MWTERLALLIALGLATVIPADEPDAATATPDLAAIEWLPSFVNTKTLEGIGRELGAKSIRRLCAYGQDDELAAISEALAAAPPRVVIAFGDHAARGVRARCPDIPMLAVLIRDAAVLESIDARAPLITMAADPSAAEVAALAAALCPAAQTVAVMHTVDFGPNKRLVEALETGAAPLKVIPIHVAPGFCRTGSDFDLALRTRYGEEPFDVLYVPDDPNCSRFGTQIFRTAQDLGVPAVGTASTVGKGCAAAFVWDIAATAIQAAEACQRLARGDRVNTRLPVPTRVQRDAAVLASFGLPLSSGD